MLFQHCYYYIVISRLLLLYCYFKITIIIILLFEDYYYYNYIVTLRLLLLLLLYCYFKATIIILLFQDYYYYIVISKLLLLLYYLKIITIIVISRLLLSLLLYYYFKIIIIIIISDYCQTKTNYYKNNITIASHRKSKFRTRWSSPLPLRPPPPDWSSFALEFATRSIAETAVLKVNWKSCRNFDGTPQLLSPVAINICVESRRATNIWTVLYTSAVPLVFMYSRGRYLVTMSNRLMGHHKHRAPRYPHHQPIVVHRAVRFIRGQSPIRFKGNWASKMSERESEGKRHGRLCFVL